MINKKYTIEDLLNSLKGDNTDNSEGLSPKKIWDMIANKESYEKMGFQSEQELKTFIENNPYSNL